MKIMNNILSLMKLTEYIMNYANTPSSIYIKKTSTKKFKNKILKPCQL